MFCGSGVRNKNQQKIDQKCTQDGKASWHQILMDFGGFLDGNWEGKWSQNRAKKATKIRWEIVIICNRFVGTFWSQVGRENGPKMHTKRH